jgi:GNAT superfamily N-acetyltransferase
MPVNAPYTQTGQIAKKFQQAGLGLKEMLALIEMTWEDNPQESPLVPSSQVFADLDRLIRHTAQGSRIKRFRAVDRKHPFQSFEVYAREGEILGYLNMLYFRKPLPCYYLVYVEIDHPFRGRGLGGRIIEAFKELVESKGALGLLDNIIPPDDPTFDLYTKLGWKPVEAFTGTMVGQPSGHYLFYRPPSMKVNNLTEKLPKLLFNLQKKRPVIEMRDNEEMVKRTIREFNLIYLALEKLFQEELRQGQSTPLMRFMFTKFTTRFLHFRRRIQDLLGYTGGESLEQIAFSEPVKGLTIQAYSFNWETGLKVKPFTEGSFWDRLPEEIRKDPTRSIEGLPLYRRPYLREWLGKTGRKEPLTLTIGDLLDLGFDPTRLREITLQKEVFMLERVTPLLIAETEAREAALRKAVQKALNSRINGSRLLVNPPLLWIQERGNGYILRKKIPGIHGEEALSQLRSQEALKDLNRQLRVDKTIERTIGAVQDFLKTHLRLPAPLSPADLAVFVPWDLQGNRPLVAIDDRLQPYLEQVWLA